MTNQADESEDRRVARTRQHVFAAFGELVQSTRYDELRTADIVERAGVGRSTFYEHFANKDDVLRQSLAGPFSVIANVASGRGDTDHVRRILEHFWERRSVARIIMSPPTVSVVQDTLVALIRGRCAAAADGRTGTEADTAASERSPTRRDSTEAVEGDARAAFLAAGCVAVLQRWLTGGIPASPDVLAQWLVREMAPPPSRESSSHRQR